MVRAVLMDLYASIDVHDASNSILFYSMLMDNPVVLHEQRSIVIFSPDLAIYTILIFVRVVQLFLLLLLTTAASCWRNVLPLDCRGIWSPLALKDHQKEWPAKQEDIPLYNPATFYMPAFCL